MFKHLFMKYIIHMFLIFILFYIDISMCMQGYYTYCHANKVKKNNVYVESIVYANIVFIYLLWWIELKVYPCDIFFLSSTHWENACVKPGKRHTWFFEWMCMCVYIKQMMCTIELRSLICKIKQQYDWI